MDDRVLGGGQRMRGNGQVARNDGKKNRPLMRGWVGIHHAHFT